MQWTGHVGSHSPPSHSLQPRTGQVKPVHRPIPVCVCVCWGGGGGGVCAGMVGLGYSTMPILMLRVI